MSRIPMKLLSIAAVLVAAVGTTSSALAGDDAAELATVRAKIAEKFDVIEPENVNASPIDGWYTIQKGSIVAYVSADGRYLLQGDLIDLESGINLTNERRDDARR